MGFTVMVSDRTEYGVVSHRYVRYSNYPVMILSCKHGHSYGIGNLSLDALPNACPPLPLGLQIIQREEPSAIGLAHRPPRHGGDGRTSDGVTVLGTTS